MEVGRRAPGKPRQKVWKPKVKTGCITCRTRRVKCDEGKPTCARCSSSGRKCGGYYQHQNKPPEMGSCWEEHSWQHSWTPLAVAASQVRPMNGTRITAYPQLLVFDSKVEGQSYEFFRSYSVPELTELFRVDEDFWHLSVLQLAMTQPAVRHAVTGLGALHQKFSAGHQTVIPDDTTDAQIQFALRQCNQAINALSDTTAAAQELIHKVATLMACILFTCYATLQGHQTHSIMHFRNGLKLLDSLQRSIDTTGNAGSQCDELYNAFVLALTTLEIQARTLIYDDSEILPASMIQCHASRQVRSSSSMDFMFKALADARHYFDTLLSDLQCLVQDCDVQDEWTLTGARPRQSTMNQCQVLVRRKVAGDKAFEDLLKRQTTSLDDRDRKTVLVIKLHGCLMDMYLSIFRLSSHYGDLAWDYFEPSYRTIIDLSRQILYCHDEDLSSMLLSPPPQPPSPLRATKGSHVDHSRINGKNGTLEPIADAASILKQSAKHHRPVFAFSQGVVGPLYTVAAQCRDPILRREAIVLLLRYPRREGLWDSFSAGRMGWEIMNLEEGLARKEWQQREEHGIRKTFELQTAADIPASCRVREVELLMAGPRVATVRLTTVEESERGERGSFQKIMAW
ncbi:hypothetical protein H2202_001679 [Exophiala xenobiotica]|nr:hypothetical protein H2202_001679 [Exophiala xenobiotica]KAK5409842.1 hypothetical protein LTR06_006308 [Exophiala xenobiotica]